MATELKMTSPDTRFSLIERLKDSGDERAWAEFIELYQPLILRIARKKGLQYADAAEIAQEVLSRVHQNIHKWRPEKEKGTFRGWLYCITRNLTIDFLRRRGQAKRIPISNEQDMASVPNPSREDSREFYMEYERQLFSWAAARIQAEFQPRTWKAFWLTAVIGQPVEQVALQLEMSCGAIYVARSRIMQRLTTVVKSRLDESAG